MTDTYQLEAEETVQKATDETGRVYLGGDHANAHVTALFGHIDGDTFHPTELKRARTDGRGRFYVDRDHDSQRVTLLVIESRPASDGTTPDVTK